MKREWMTAPERAAYQRGYRAAISGVRVRGVRFREGCPEMRCPECAAGGGSTCYWPLTTEFWNPRNLSACRAHLAERKRLLAREAYWRDPEAEKARVAAYQRASARARAVKDKARRDAKVDQIRAYRRLYYLRNRDRILELRRSRRAA